MTVMPIMPLIGTTLVPIRILIGTTVVQISGVIGTTGLRDSIWSYIMLSLFCTLWPLFLT